MLPQLAIRTMPVTVFIGIVWTGVSSATYAVNGLSIAGIILLCIAIIFVLLSPYLILLIYSAQVHESQPLFFGLEGYVDIQSGTPNLWHIRTKTALEYSEQPPFASHTRS